MPIDTKNITEGKVYRTNTDQLRRVDKISTDDQGRTRIHNSAKSARIPKRSFEINHTLENPPLEDTFAGSVDHELTDDEIKQLIIEGVLTRNEIDN